MTARAMWKGVLRLGEERVPVKLYSAAQDRAVGFRLLHAEDLQPVRQRMVDPGTEEEVPREEIRRGLEIAPGVFVVVEPDELESIEPPASRDIELTRFIPTGALDAAWYDRPYWLGPDDSEAAYAALARALGESGREGIARWVMRKRSYVGALRASRDHLALITLRSADEVIETSALDLGAAPSIDPKERTLAQQLVSALEGDLDVTELSDTYRERVEALIARKAAGEAPVKRTPRRAKKEPASLADSLEASLRAAKKKTAKEKKVA